MKQEQKCEEPNWGKLTVSPNKPFSFRCGDVSLSGSIENGELLLSSQTGDDTSATRWALPKGEQELLFSPALPDLPVLVEPESTLQILPGAKARVYLAIPVTVSAQSVRSKAVLEQVPSAILSQTWFGELDSGELCYRLPTALSREPFPDHRGDRITAPVEIRNAASDALPVERLCLRVSHLAVYHNEKGLWANETEVHFQGGNKSSRIEIRKGPPPEAHGAKRVGKAREHGSITKVGRSFRSLRKWTIDLLDTD